MAYKPPPKFPKMPVATIGKPTVMRGEIGSKPRKRSPYLKAIEQFYHRHPKGT